MSLFSRAKIVATVRLEGVISSSDLCLDAVKKSLDAAFRSKPTIVGLLINSPGGSPVQSSILHDYIRSKSFVTDIPVVSFVEDVAASGGYWLALAGDQIFANESSIVGSIGVISTGFGLDKLIAKYDIERRIHTSGSHKHLGDQFTATTQEGLEEIENLQKAIHQDFIDIVKVRRGERLKLDTPHLFEGKIWVGREAEKYGLLDGLGNLEALTYSAFGDNYRIRSFDDVGYQQSGGMNMNTMISRVISKLMNRVEFRMMAQKFGVSA